MNHKRVEWIWREEGMKVPHKQLDLIVLGELRYVPTGKVGAELLFDVLSTAYERQRLIVTTNLPFEQ